METAVSVRAHLQTNGQSGFYGGGRSNHDKIHLSSDSGKIDGAVRFSVGAGALLTL